MVAVLITMVIVWCALFFGIGSSDSMMGFIRTREFQMAQMDWLRTWYMAIGGIVCIVGALADMMWFSDARSHGGGRTSLASKYRSWMGLSIVAGVVGVAVLFFMKNSASGSTMSVLTYICTLLAGLLVFVVGACISTPPAGKKYPPFG